jgi:hypothetical protein
MQTRMRFALILMAGLLLAEPVAAQTPPPSPTLTPAARSEIVTALAHRLRDEYVFPDVGKALAARLAAKLKAGGYDALSAADAFQTALTDDLRTFGKDSHLRVRFRPDFRPGPPPGAALTPEQAAEARAEMAAHGFGLNRIERLPGNVGYLDVRGFFPTEFAAPAISAAMTLLGGSDALILDLRNNGGGEPQTVAYLLSYFFAEGDERHLNDIYNRLDGTTHSYWTDRSVGTRYMGPIYVLTSHDTFSGAEECAYDLKTQKRATLVGETTGGGANPGDYVPLADGFIAFIPTGQSINPVTKANWEHVGVAPDVPASAGESLGVAYVAALKALAAKSADPDDRKDLMDTAERAGRNQIALPAYVPRH